MNAIITNNDAELVNLGEALAVAIAAERVALDDLRDAGKMDDDRALDAACAPVSGIIDRMRDYRPTTVAGFAAIQLAVAWVNGSLPTEIDDFSR